MIEKLFLGENCDEQLFSRNVQEKAAGGYGLVVGVVFATIVIIGALLAAWMYHRRRVADLKSEIAQVQYTAEPVPPPGKLHFLFLIATLKIDQRQSSKSFNFRAEKSKILLSS